MGIDHGSCTWNTHIDHMVGTGLQPVVVSICPGFEALLLVANPRAHVIDGAPLEESPHLPALIPRSDGSCLRGRFLFDFVVRRRRLRWFEMTSGVEAVLDCGL